MPIRNRSEPIGVRPKPVGVPPIGWGVSPGPPVLPPIDSGDTPRPSGNRPDAPRETPGVRVERAKRREDRRKGGGVARVPPGKRSVARRAWAEAAAIRPEASGEPPTGVAGRRTHPAICKMTAAHAQQDEHRLERSTALSTRCRDRSRSPRWSCCCAPWTPGWPRSPCPPGSRRSFRTIGRNSDPQTTRCG